MVALQLLALIAAAAAPLASAHFVIVQPPWRADTLAADKPNRYNQWIFPCAGVLSNDTGVNVTDWPLDGGSVVLDLHHDWTYLVINLGLPLTDGTTVTSFNYTLTGPTFWNVTGMGTLFIQKLALPPSLKPVDGQRASIQVVTPGPNGTAVYNCADIRFRSNATTLSSSRYKTSDGVSFYPVQSGPASTSTSGGSGTVGASTGVNGVVLATVVGMVVVFAYGIGW